MKSKKPVLLFALMLTVCCLRPTSVSADADAYLRNWPQWRGPSGNGIVHHGSPPLEWGEDRNIKWKVAIPGKGHATPVIWEDKVFILTAVPTGNAIQAEASGETAQRPDAPPQRENAFGGNRGSGRSGRGGFGGRGQAPTQEYAFTVLCLNRGTGDTIWQKVSRTEIPHQGVQSSNTHSSGSPTTDGEHLYVSFGSQGLYCYDLDGDLVWSKDLGEVSVTFGEGASPALAGDVLVVVQDNNGDSFIYGFNKRTGEEIWRQPREEGSGWTTPYVVTHQGSTQVIVNGSTAVRSYDPQTGKVLWQCSGLGSNPVPMIVSDSSAAYAMSGHRNGAALAIELGRSGDLSGSDAVRWQINRGTPYVPSPLLYDGLLYFCQRNDGILTCLDVSTGDVHFEQERVDAVSGIYASPIGVNERIYWPGQNGVTLVLARSKTLEVLASNQLDDGFDASPAVVGNELFLRGRENLYCIAAD